MNTEIVKEKKYTIEQLGTKLEKLESKIKKIKELEVEYDSFKEKMYEAMNENGCTKYISPNGITFTSVAPTQDKTELKVEFDTEKFECEVIMKNESLFTFIHRKTTPITEKNYPVYSTQILARYNYSANILFPRNEVEKFILLQFRDKKVFYQDNEVGESIRNFLMYCQKNK